ncbi:MAG: tRNA uridine-5-carboxymethylaminomethyl(34) synthesis enzyme MnmG [Firmicutes bacterium]|nr:tRNA uridine-5-carboxymethylaminomethyl(34) synthesis enzyme MnmG [Bacillota bacterium]
MNTNVNNKYDAIVIGCGHAGIEAGLALTRTGQKTLILGINLDSVGYLACNPSIGGTGKGHLVREVDALGGEMGRAADASLTQLRMLNSSKGAAVRSLRAQVDKYKYHAYMKRILEKCGAVIKQGEVKDLLINNGKIAGVTTVIGAIYYASKVIVASGVYLNSAIIIGEIIEERGPAGFNRANYLSKSLSRLGVKLRRFKTGTPARVHSDTIDYSKFDIQYGEKDIYFFSEMTKRADTQKSICHLGYTNEHTHQIIKDNLSKSPKYGGLIKGAGARYCPSIEDKIVRFGDKDRHQFFLEPEGEGTVEVYVQGMSTAMPPDVQEQIYRSVEGLENVEIMRDAYAIEYDCIDPLKLNPTLEYKDISGLYFAGQINGTSGYEEAAVQGLVAGLNASLSLRDKPPLIFTRDNSYIGVLIDDLVTLGTDEPYRMMTGRAEYRLSLRQDNADIRLTKIGYDAGLVCRVRYNKFKKKLKQISEIQKLLDTTVFKPTQIAEYFEKINESLPQGSITLREIIRRSNVNEHNISQIGTLNAYPKSTVFSVITEVKYEGYLARQANQITETARLENMSIPKDWDYNMSSLRLEAREKLSTIRPMTVGQASRISGVTPGDINVLLLAIKRNEN